MIPPTMLFSYCTQRGLLGGNVASENEVLSACAREESAQRKDENDGHCARLSSLEGTKLTRCGPENQLPVVEAWLEIEKRGKNAPVSGLA